MFSVDVNNLKGERGSVYIPAADTALYTPDQTKGCWTAIECIADCIFTTLVDETSLPKDVHTITLLAGRVTYGNFSAVKLASGSVKLYY
jgi:hypothetical protein